METTQKEGIINMMRVIYMINYPCTDLFRDILRQHVTEIQMTERLSEAATKKTLLSSAVGSHLKKILYPPNGCFTGDYTGFDLSALYCLIRNISGIPPPSNGWGKSPNTSDRSVSANVERLRTIRNVHCAHGAGKTMEESEFQTLWNEIETSIKELEDSLPWKSTKYRDEATNWKTCLLDSTLPAEKLEVTHQILMDMKDDISKLIKIQEEQETQTAKIQGKVDALQPSLSSLIEIIDALNVQGKEDAALLTLIENTDIILLGHRDSETYIRAEAVNATLKILEEYHIAILVGKPGDGKTATAHQVMLEISNIGHSAENVDHLGNMKHKRAVKIQSPDEWQKYIDPNKDLVVYFEDCFGSTNFNSKAAAKWRSSLDLIYESAKYGKVYVLISLQSAIIEKIKKTSFYHRLFNDEFMVDVSHLKDNEKMEILNAYEKCYIQRKNKNVKSQVVAHKSDRWEISDRDKCRIVESKIAYGFPLACRLFFESEKFHDMGYKFFYKPDEELLKDVETMRRKKRIRYVVLAYVLIKGKINPYDLDEDILTDICTALKRKQKQVSRLQISDAIDKLKSGYLEVVSNTTEYSFSHSTVLDIVLLSFGKVAPGIVLKRCSRRCLYELIRTPKSINDVNETELIIPSECFLLLVERLLQVGSAKQGSTTNNLKVAIDIVWHPATLDDNFVDVLLDFKQLKENNNLLKKLWYVFPGSSSSIILDKMLSMYGFEKENAPTRVEKGTDTFNDKEGISANVKESDDAQSAIKVMSFISQCIGNFKGNSHILCCLKYIEKDHRLHKLLDNHFKYSPGGMTLLHCSILLGWDDVVDHILKIHTPTSTENQWTCLHFSAYIGNCSMFQKFVERGLDIEAKTTEGYSVLQTCFIGMRYGSGETIWPSYSVSENDRFQMTLFFPAENDYEDVVRHIFQCKPLSFLNEIENKIDDFGNNILHYVVIQDYGDILEFLCRQNEDAEFERTSTTLPTLLHLAVYLGRSSITKQLWSDAIRPLDFDLSLEETLVLGRECNSKSVAISRLNHIKKHSWCWNDGQKEMAGIPFHIIADIDVIFGKENDFVDVECFLESQGIGNKKLHNAQK